MFDKRTARRKVGDIGENIACDFLTKRGFEIVERNYLRKWGEIDIVARKGSMTRFIEVKSIRGTSYRPEENMHPGKLRRLYRTIETYIMDRRVDGDWQLDLITVQLDEQARSAKVEIIENIVG